MFLEKMLVSSKGKDVFFVRNGLKFGPLALLGGSSHDLQVVNNHGDRCCPLRSGCSTSKWPFYGL